MEKRIAALLLLAYAVAADQGHVRTAIDVPDAVLGLKYGYYRDACPSAEQMVRSAVKSFISPNISRAGALIRLTFHDCFVQGCDASVLLNGTNSEEQDAPNLTLRPEALRFVQDVKEQLEATCPGTVSCADILALAGRDATAEAGGLDFKVATGRLDSLGFADKTVVLEYLPSSTSNISALIDLINELGLDKTDLVALSGAHTVGIAHCAAFNNSLRPVNTELDAKYVQVLLKVCPDTQSNEVIEQDLVTPNVFDNQYFKNMLQGEVLFDSDRALLADETTKAVVEGFAESNSAFLKQFAYSFAKMSMINVKTWANGGQGTIRNVCYSSSSSTPSTASTSALPGVNMLYTAEESLFGSN